MDNCDLCGEEFKDDELFQFDSNEEIYCLECLEIKEQCFERDE